MLVQTIREKIERCSVEKIIAWIFFVGLLVRFSLPDFKVLHHDEAIHAWFSYELLTKGIYQYDPTYHGPLLYYLAAGAFRIFGDSDIVARMLPALFGSAIILLIYGIHKTGWLSRNHTIWAAIFFALSPNMVYFSRFLRHDIFQLFFTILLLLSILLYLERKQSIWAVLAGFSAACGLCLKEDMPIAILVFGLFFTVLITKGLVSLPKNWKKDGFYAILIAAVTGFILYSSFFAYPAMFIEAPLKAIEHWTSVHDQCRLCGPPYWYLLMFILYEVPLLLLALYAVIQWIWKDKGFSAIRRNDEDCREPISESSKTSLFMLLAVLWTITTVAFYGYVGEKVPWLLIHQLFPVILLASFKIEGKKIFAGIITGVFLLIMTLHLCFTPVDINEPIVQVQNSEDVREIMKLIDAADTVVIASNTYWPLPWYYRGDKWQKIQLYGGRVEPETWEYLDPDLIITHDIESYSYLDGYDKLMYHQSYWFSWFDNQHRLLEWYFLRDGKRGTVNFDVFVKNSSYTR